MKRLPAIAFALVVLGLFAAFRTPLAGPELVFKTDSHDFGELKAGEKASQVFKFQNAGNAPLIIQEVLVQCGCTAPEWPKTPILPGQTGEITINYDSAGKSGLQRKTITVVYNSDTRATLTITAFVKP